MKRDQQLSNPSRRINYGQLIEKGPRSGRNAAGCAPQSLFALKLRAGKPVIDLFDALCLKQGLNMMTMFSEWVNMLEDDPEMQTCLRQFYFNYKTEDPQRYFSSWTNTVALRVGSSCAARAESLCLGVLGHARIDVLFRVLVCYMSIQQRLMPAFPAPKNPAPAMRITLHPKGLRFVRKLSLKPHEMVKTTMTMDAATFALFELLKSVYRLRNSELLTAMVEEVAADAMVARKIRARLVNIREPRLSGKRVIWFGVEAQTIALLEHVGLGVIGELNSSCLLRLMVCYFAELNGITKVSA